LNKTLEQDLKWIVNSVLPWDRFAGKSILITGASGCLPSYMAKTLLYLNKEKLKDNPCKVYALVRSLEKAQKRFADFSDAQDIFFLEQDVCFPLPEELKVNFIIHAASNASPTYYKSDPVGVLAANLLGTRQLLEFGKDHSVDGFLYFSSGEIYGEVKSSDFPIREETVGNVDPISLRACYAEGKRAGEALCKAYNHQFDVPAIVIRPFHTYGGGYDLNDGRVFMDFVRDAIQKDKIVMHSDGSATRAFCYIADAITGFFTALLKGSNGEAYNVASEQEISIIEFAQCVSSVFPTSISIEYSHQSRPTQYVTSPISRTLVCNSKLKELGWKESFSLLNGVKRMVNYYKENI
jgi:UDP-glucuronate decarboxylase